MTPAELRAECEQQLAAGRDFIRLSLSRRCPPVGWRVRLFPGGPLGEILVVSGKAPSYQVVGQFNPAEVLAALAKAEA